MRRALWLVVTVGLGLVLALPGDAGAKPCPRLCRRDIKACKDTCTGSRRQRRPCKRGCKTGLLTICKGFTERACVPPEGPCGPTPLTCELLALGVQGFRPGDASGLPADFPPPPGGARLCGSLAASGTGGSALFVFYASAAGADAIATYYEGAFPGRGLGLAETAVDADRASCDQAFRATRNGQPAGGVYLFAGQSAFAVVSGTASIRPPGKR